ncbi:MAG: hypothetical protein PUB87_03170 [Eubacteriaceae bacterium]|nr:hypothetical protein [Eubacteriaceae bacterium]
MIVEKKTFITAMFVLLTAIIGVVFNSPIVCRACVLLLFVICILRGMREKYFLNPYYMFALVPFTLLIYANISNYHLDLTVNTWLIAIINIASFVIALDFTPEYKHLEKCKGVGDGIQLAEHTIILLVLGFMPTVYTLVLGGIMPLASIFTLFSSGAIVCALKSRNKVLIGIVISVFIISWVGYVSKSSVLTFAIAILIGYEKYYVESAKQKRRLIVLAILGLLLMIAAFSFANQGRGSKSGMNAVQYYATYGDLTWNRNASLLMPYMYMTTPWANLQYVMETQANHTYGLWLIKPLISYFQFDSLFSKFYELRAYSNFNTFTYLAYCFKDFGFWGSCISSVFLGIFTKKVYSRFTVSRSPLDVACYILVAQAVVEMFFSNHFFTQSYPFSIVVIMGIYKLVFCKNYDVELETCLKEIE